MYVSKITTERLFRHTSGRLYLIKMFTRERSYVVKPSFLIAPANRRKWENKFLERHFTSLLLEILNAQSFLFYLAFLFSLGRETDDFFTDVIKILLH